MSKKALVIVVSDLMLSRRHNNLRSPLPAFLRDDSSLSSKTLTKNLFFVADL